MARPKKSSGRPRKSAPPKPGTRAYQREWLKLMQTKIAYLDDLSLMLMFERGILPPFYGGEYLEESSEIIPLWGVSDDGNDALGILFLRIHPFLEPSEGLETARAEMGLSNELSVNEVFESLQAVKPIKIEGRDSLADLKVALALSGEQVTPVAGQDMADTLDHMRQGLPIAAFVQIPTHGQPDSDEFDYDWELFDQYQVTVLCAQTPEEMEAAVWQYRIDIALADELTHALPGTPESVVSQTVPNSAEMAALFDRAVLTGMRFYGVTSPIKAKQQALDIIRQENDDLVVYRPLKPDVEPIQAFKLARIDSDEAIALSVPGPGADPRLLLRVQAWSEPYRSAWTEARSHPYFALRVHTADLAVREDGTLNVKGFVTDPVIEWVSADSLPELYQRVTWASLRQMLAALGSISLFDGLYGDDEADEFLDFVAEHGLDADFFKSLGIELPAGFDLSASRDDTLIDDPDDDTDQANSPDSAR